LVLASGAVVPSEALARAVRVVAQTTARAVTPLGGTIPLHHIRARRTLHQRAVGAAAAEIAHASDVLGRVPRSVVHTLSFKGKLLLSEAYARFTARIRARGSLASYSFVVLETLALPAGAIANTFIRALNHRVGIVGLNYTSDPRQRFRAGSSRAVSVGPGGLAVDAIVASALVVGAARSMTGAAVGARCQCHRGKGCK
jgi:hypothetical protein